MAQQVIGIGSAANDGNGDSLRVGGEKINENFTEVYAGLNWRGAYDLSATNNYPTSGGTGAAGVPSPGNEWYVSVSGTLNVTGLGVIPIEYGALLKYLGGAVGSPSSWKVTQ